MRNKPNTEQRPETGGNVARQVASLAKVHNKMKRGLIMNYLEIIIFGIQKIADHVFPQFNAKAILCAEEKENPFGGNPDYIVEVTFFYKGCWDGSMKFRMQPASESFEMFENRIKAYLFEHLDYVAMRGKTES